MFLAIGVLCLLQRLFRLREHRRCVLIGTCGPSDSHSVTGLEQRERRVWVDPKDGIVDPLIAGGVGITAQQLVAELDLLLAACARKCVILEDDEAARLGDGEIRFRSDEHSEGLQFSGGFEFARPVFI